MNRSNVAKSKYLSLVLRHNPETIGLKLDGEGWALIAELLERANAHGFRISREELDEIVETSDKKRFAISSDGLRIRANQGHSIVVDLRLVPKTPPEFLYHGTVGRFLPSIREHGLVKGQRHHVHLSPDAETATAVGSRRGNAVILAVRSGDMMKAGYLFYCADNGVWLTDHVPAAFVAFPAT